MLSSHDQASPDRGSRDQALLHDGKPIESALDAANYFGVKYGKLIYGVYKAPLAKRYTAFEIPKRSGGMRQILSPVGITRELQTKLAPVLAALYQAHPSAHGFIKERSILSNAEAHVGQRFVFNVDLEDFFPTINFGRVRGLFMAPPFRLGPAAASVFAQLCTYRNGLPQGAPTSPALSNFIAADLDRRLTRLARECNARYTRYADDITFSCNQATMPPTLAVFAQGDVSQGRGGVLTVRAAEPLERAIASAGFSINHAKVRLQRHHQRQSVTGLSVNAKPNVTRKRIRRLRAMLHAWEKFGLDQAARHHFLRYRAMLRLPNYADRKFRNIVYGQLSFIKMVRGAEDPVFLNFAAKLLKLDPNPSGFVRQMVFGAADYDVFISHASEDKEEIARPIFEACGKLGLKVFLDEAHIGWGQNFTEKINTALGSAHTVLAIISSTAIAKEWPIVEVNTALSLEVTGEKKVVPLLVGRPDLSKLPLIKGKDSMIWNGDAMAVARRLKEAAAGDAPRRPAGSPPTPMPNAPAPVAPAMAVSPRATTGPWDQPSARPTPRKRGLFGWLFGRGRQ